MERFVDGRHIDISNIFIVDTLGQTFGTALLRQDVQYRLCLDHCHWLGFGEYPSQRLALYSIMKGGIAIGSILLFQTIFSKLTLKSKAFDKLVSNKPLLLMDGETILYKNLRGQGGRSGNYRRCVGNTWEEWKRYRYHTPEKH